MVLAIAGLIFLVVFEALPGLQASRRDNQRKRNAEEIFSLALEYQSNSGNVLTNAQMVSAFAATPSDVFSSYVTASAFEDPSGVAYVAESTPTNPATEGRFLFDSGRLCDANNSALTATGASATNMALIMRLERGFYCIDG